MQAIVETLFDAVYLISVITIGILMIRGSKGRCAVPAVRRHGGGAGSGRCLPSDSPGAMRCVPRALKTTPSLLGLGKWITSVTMTIFYVLLYYVWRQRYQVKGQSRSDRRRVCFWPDCGSCLCMMPQNQWLSADAPLSWGDLPQHSLRACWGCWSSCCFTAAPKSRMTGRSAGCG